MFTPSNVSGAATSRVTINGATSAVTFPVLLPVLVVSPNVTSTLGDVPVTFSAIVEDQSGIPFAVQPALTWSLVSGSAGALAANGASATYTPTNAFGVATVSVSDGSQTTLIPLSIAPEPNYPNGFSTPDNGFTLDGGATRGATLHLTDLAAAQTRSIFYTTKLNVSHFVTSFNLQFGGSGNMSEGLTFTIQNQAAIAPGNGGGGLGSQGIASSASIKFDIWSNNGEGTDSTGCTSTAPFRKTSAPSI